MKKNKFYVYAYFLKSTNEIFHIGKGTGNRYKDKNNHRNQYFRNIIQKYKDDVDVKIIKDNLSEQEAWSLERDMIEQYKKIGQCKTNLHEGGCGGNTGNYDNPERSKKISDFAKTRTGEKNPNYHNFWSEEQKQLASERTKDWWQKHPEQKQKMGNIHKNKEPWNKGLTAETDSRIKPTTKGRKMSEEEYQKMMDRDCPYLYQVFLEGEKIYENISSTKLRQFCSKELGISRTIIDAVIAQKWTPTFRRHQRLKTLKILRIDRKCID